MNKADRAAVLHQVTQFGALSETEFEALNAHSTLIELTGGTTLLQEGAEGNDAYVLVTGALEVTQQKPKPQNRQRNDPRAIDPTPATRRDFCFSHAQKP